MVRCCYIDIPNKEDIRNDLLRKKFNMELNVIQIPTKDFKTTVLRLFEEGNPPDFVENMRPDYGLDELVHNGYLRGFDMEALQRRLPDYLMLFTKEEWKDVYRQIRFTDGKVYHLPGRRAQDVRTVWMYRKDIFDKHRLDFPRNPEEVLNVCRILKQKEGKVPILLHDPTPLNPLFAFGLIFQMYGLLDLLPREFSYVDPLTNKFHPFAFTEEISREAIITVSKFIKEGLFWDEFATGFEDEIMEFRKQGNGFLMWGYPDKAIEHNKFTKDVYPDADWTWSKEMPSAFSDKTFYKREPFHYPEGPAINVKLSDNKIERVLAYINWACTEEGLSFHTFGEKGKTAKIQDGKWMFMDHMQSSKNPMGEKLGVYAKGMAGGFASAFMSIHPHYNEVYNPVFKEMENNFIGKPGYYYIKPPEYRFTTEEKSRLTQLIPLLMSTINDYFMMFAMGDMNASKDSDWKQYKDALEDVGLKEFTKIKTVAYGRVNG